jgi:hypothetical protein
MLLYDIWKYIEYSKKLSAVCNSCGHEGAEMMVHTTDQPKGYPGFGYCGTMMKHGQRSCGIGFGIMLTLIGAIWLAAEMGWIVPDLFWPVALLGAGLVMLTISISRGRKHRNGKSTDKEV